MEDILGLSKSTSKESIKYYEHKADSDNQNGENDITFNKTKN